MMAPWRASPNRNGRRRRSARSSTRSSAGCARCGPSRARRAASSPTGPRAGPITAIIVYLLHVEDDALPLWAQLLKPVFPWAYNLIWLVPVHYGLRLFGSTRKLRTTVGASFYAGGPLHLARLLVVPLQLDQMAHPHDFRLALASGIGGLVIMLLFCFYMTATMAGAHRLRTGRTALVVIVVFVISAIFWGWFGIRTGRAGLRVIRALIT
jgi:hypothetical protein